MIICENVPLTAVCPRTEPPPLEPGVAQVWLAKADQMTDEKCAELFEWLSPGERQKLDKFRRESDWQTFLLSHGLLRFLTGKFTGTSTPEQIEFGAGDFGKPYLMAPPTPLSFNISHAHGRVAVAFVSGKTEIGIDLEKTTQNIDYQLITHHYFSTKEQKSLQSKTDFFRLWTRKEALLKWAGIGLTDDLPNLEVHCSGEPRSNDPRWAPFRQKTVFIRSHEMGEYIFSFAAERPLDIRFFEWI
ncbi:MAG: 4'-phosphopantetheinyl transferase superfamily protein [Bacteroidetes bacterium]|nr:MAG: 4'-phosphopantetheinyl transferase superfamily protein [Bacteroidota bacterium]